MTFVLPNLFTGPEVIIPRSQMDWLLQQPDHILDQNEVNRDFLQADHTMLHRKIIFDAVHSDVIRKEMTSGLDKFTESVMEEIDHAFRLNWGVDTDNWKSVAVYGSMLDIIARISSRVLVGLPMCKSSRPARRY
jgi:hypothetical protein